jgi:hypothetical protein
MNAETIFSTIIEDNQEITSHRFHMGAYLHLIQDQEHWRGKADTFNEYLTTVGKRSTLRDNIKLFEFYILDCKLTINDIVDIDTDKLLAAIPIVKANKNSKLIELTLDMCRTNSMKDIINEAREVSGKPPMKAEIKTSRHLLSKPGTSSSYKEFVQNHPCILCGKKSDAAHFPRTRVRGKFMIPLCRECHRHQEDLPKSDFIKLYSEPVDNYLTELAMMLFGKIS